LLDVKDGRAAPRRTNDSPIARKRRERGMTQAQLAEKVGCYTKDVSRWETGERKPASKSLYALAQALGCTIDELMG
ncbi:MAG: helix-turn-helix transcriptional regulator, partial [Oscillospiraceae bacterium]|nr:helix-turn-helix transcriptional regulator [Oscillospiraceae bacterium]